LIAAACSTPVNAGLVNWVDSNSRRNTLNEELR